ncbi:riboflavin synthase [Leptolyngbya sp. 15MV]|nr:riboflavin synthase [Leptolyngbya sp. 15MV]
MFTGIIEELGRVSALNENAGGVRISIAANYITEDIHPGDSIAVNGVCLTVLCPDADGFSADVSPETLKVTTIGSLGIGSLVNLERAVAPSGRLGGHIVQGHVDGMGTFLGAVPFGDFWTVHIGFPSELGRYFIHKGSVAVEGISLTIAALSNEAFEIAVIPKTWEMTSLSALNAGDPVNLEVDMVAKYIERLLEHRGA